MLTRGMSHEEVMAIVEGQDWEVLEERLYEEDGEEWTEMTIWQGDHAVAITIDEEGVYEIQYVPAWALD